MRLDQYLVNEKIISGRDKARLEIESGNVLVNSKAVKKPSYKVLDTDKIEFIGVINKYVSRGGFKLEKAINFFNIDVTNKVVLDVGASTGGFTDCLLQNGAKKVISLDVGHNQLDKKLLLDDRVVNLEGINFKDLDEIDEDKKSLLKSFNYDYIVSDVSFISLTKLIDSFKRVSSDTKLLLLIKPQFEVGRGKLNKKGVVTDFLLHKEVLENVINSFIAIGFSFFDLTYSPIKGPEGNIEYLLYLKYKETLIETNDKTEEFNKRKGKFSETLVLDVINEAKEKMLD